MEILKTENVPTLVSNIEILHLLRNRINTRNASTSEQVNDDPSKQRRTNPKMRHRDWVEESVVASLEYTPCVKLKLETLPELVSTLKSPRFALTDGEAMQVLNLVPRELVDLHLIIEDLGSRMSEEKQTDLLETIGKFLIDSEQVEGDGGEKMDEDEHGEVAEQEIWGDDL